MPKKTIKEMSELERRRHSLEAKTFHAVLMGSLILGVMSLILGLGLYVYSLGNQYINEAFELTKNAEGVIENVGDVRDICNETLDIYHSLSDEERAVQDEEYFARFDTVTKSEVYPRVIDFLLEYYASSDVNDIFIAMYDEETQALVYVADPDDKRPLRTGAWEEETAKEISQFLNSDGSTEIYNISYTDKYGWLCTTGVPIFNYDGSIASFILADVSLEELLHGMRSFTILYTIATILTVLLLGFLLSRHIRKNMVEPINMIAEAAEAYVKDKKDGGTLSENHFKGLGIDTGDEIENLYFTLSDMEKDLNAYEEDLTKAIQEQQRIGTELDLAKRIQEDMLPTIFPPFPERKDFDVYASMIPAKEVGGDFYDYFLIDDDHLCIIMADVSGKGVPAALFMMASKILLKTTAMAIPEPGKILARVNNQICSNNSLEMFVTAWLGILELSTGKLTAANAGHEYPIIRQHGGRYELYRDKHGFVMGGMEGMEYKEYEVLLKPGSEVFLYTDGVTEATSEKNEQFGTKRLLESLNSGLAPELKGVLERVNDAVDVFVGDAPQFDDITMLCLYYAGADATDSSEEQREGRYMKEMTLEATVGNIPIVTDFINTELEALECPMKAQIQIDIAVDELFGNIAQYAYDPLTGPATVRVEVDDDPMAVIITFIDHGKPYDPLAGKEPDITLNAEDREVGGLGVFLVKKTMDEITYEYKNGQNILKIRKNMQEG
ncbi:MAG: SpoIIE family protein phosphatase [Firmicutes bacterium]|nr:SpoIIE family protein phosphatase [Bacillota bacterium]